MKVEWNRPTPVFVGKNNIPSPSLGLNYASKCGRFTIRKRRFELPTRQTYYALTDSKTGRVYRDNETLREAREWADDLVSES